MNQKIVGRIDGFARTTCPRCRRESLGTCAQCRQIATLIVESCAMNLAMLPLEAFADADSDPIIVAAVEAARMAFHTAPGITDEHIQRLTDKIHDDVREGLTALDAQTDRKES